jgi:hypothetical protein
MGKPTVSTVLWMVFAWMISMPVTAEEVKKSPAPLVEMSLSPSRIEWHSADPAAKIQRWVLTLSGPDELFLRREFKAGKAPFLSVFDSEGDLLPDGSYTWALKAISNDSVDPRRESGSFSIQEGSFVEAPRTTGSGAPKPPLVPNIAESSYIDGDLVVHGDACIGDSCSITDPNFSALKLKSVQPNILFDDIALPEGPTSSHDWALFVNYNDVDQFSIVDFTNARFPFSIAAGAPDNSLFVAGDGKVGLGTASPAERFHLFEDLDANTILLVENPNTGLSAAGVLRAKSDSAMVNFEAHGSGRTLSRFGQPLASWAEFLQVTGNGLIMGTLADKPLILGTNNTNRLHITGAGNIGIGTATPLDKLDIQASADGAAPGRIGSSSATGYSGWEYEDETGAVIAFAGLDNLSNRFRINSISNHPIVLHTNGAEHVRIDSDGDVGINCDNPASDLVIASGFGCNPPSSSINAGSTSFTVSSSRTIKENLSTVKVPDILEKIAGVGVYTYDFIGGPQKRIGLMAEDFHQIFQRGSDKTLDGQEVEMALWLAVQELTAQNKKLAEQNKEISERLAELEARLATGPVNKP